MNTAPPENLFPVIASSPSLLAVLAAYTSPATLLDTLTKHLLDPPDDVAQREMDPQGTLTRFGEGVVLVEAVAAQYQVSHTRESRRWLGADTIAPAA
jgi:mediator of RNA polymerase II transcription subunit 5